MNCDMQYHRQNLIEGMLDKWLEFRELRQWCIVIDVTGVSSVS
jgi:hypothetical protein